VLLDGEIDAYRRLAFMLNIIMSKSRNIVKRKRGRPPEIDGGATAFVGLRLPAALLKSIDDWAKQQRIAARSDAMRRLIERGLQT
jgi:hypothetical protein